MKQTSCENSVINVGMMPLVKKIDDISAGKLMILVGAGAFLALLPAWMNYDIISRDGAFQYVPAARVFLEGNFHEGFLRRELPLFPMIMACIAKITGFDLELSGRIASYLAYVLAAIGMFKLSETVFKNRFIALLAVLFLITNRQFVDRSIDCLKESLLICCIVWGNYFILKGIAVTDKRVIYYSLGVVTFLTGMLSRSTALVFLCVWFAVWLFHKRDGIAVRASVLLIPATLFFLIWAVILDKSLSWKSYHLNYFFVYQHSIMDVLRSAADVLARFFSTGNPILVLAGFFGLYRWKKDVYYFYSCLVFLISFLVLVPWPMISDRYLLAPIIWVYPLASFGIFRIFRSGSRLLKIIAVLTVFSTIVLWADIAFTPPDQDKLARKEAGYWILDNLGPGQEIFTNRDRLVFYAQGTYKPLSKVKAGSTIHQVLAVDTKYEEGRIIVEEAHSRGVDPDKRFRSIFVYLPES